MDKRAQQIITAINNLKNKFSGTGTQHFWNTATYWFSSDFDECSWYNELSRLTSEILMLDDINALIFLKKLFINKELMESRILLLKKELRAFKNDKYDFYHYKL